MPRGGKADQNGCNTAHHGGRWRHPSAGQARCGRGAWLAGRAATRGRHGVSPGDPSGPVLLVLLWSSTRCTPSIGHRAHAARALRLASLNVGARATGPSRARTRAAGGLAIDPMWRWEPPSLGEGGRWAFKFPTAPGEPPHAAPHTAPACGEGRPWWLSDHEASECVKARVGGTLAGAVTTALDGHVTFATPRWTLSAGRSAARKPRSRQ
jgi:hypothetical protein